MRRTLLFLVMWQEVRRLFLIPAFIFGAVGNSYTSILYASGVNTAEKQIKECLPRLFGGER